MALVRGALGGVPRRAVPGPPVPSPAATCRWGAASRGHAGHGRGDPAGAAGVGVVPGAPARPPAADVRHGLRLGGSGGGAGLVSPGRARRRAGAGRAHAEPAGGAGWRDVSLPLDGLGRRGHAGVRPAPHRPRGRAESRRPRACCSASPSRPCTTSTTTAARRASCWSRSTRCAATTWAPTATRGRPRRALDALAREGILAEDAVSTSSWTLPAHLSMLTSVDPGAHGGVDMQHGFNRRLPTLPALLKRRGLRDARRHQPPLRVGRLRPGRGLRPPRLPPGPQGHRRGRPRHRPARPPAATGRSSCSSTSTTRTGTTTRREQTRGLFEGPYAGRRSPGPGRTSRSATRENTSARGPRAPARAVRRRDPLHRRPGRAGSSTT